MEGSGSRDRGAVTSSKDSDRNKIKIASLLVLEQILLGSTSASLQKGHFGNEPLLFNTQSRQGASSYSISPASTVYTGEHLHQHKRFQLTSLQRSGTRPTVSPRFACRHSCKQQKKLPLISISSDASGIGPLRDRPKVSKLEGIILKCSLRHFT